MSETSKQKIIIMEQIKLEINQMKMRMDDQKGKNDKIDDKKSFISKSSNQHNISNVQPKQDKKGFMGIVKNFFKK
jgi:hypothetical protein